MTLMQLAGEQGEAVDPAWCLASGRCSTPGATTEKQNLLVEVGINGGGVVAAGGVDNKGTGKNAGRGKDRCIAKVRPYQEK